MNSPAICEVEGARAWRAEGLGTHNDTIFLPDTSKNCAKENTNNNGEKERNGGAIKWACEGDMSYQLINDSTSLVPFVQY
jgi:hypothetical protein